MRVLALLADAYGGRGGIAEYGRHLLEALCGDPRVRQVVALPRVVPESPGPLPDGLRFCSAAAGGKLRYARHLARWAMAGGPAGFEVVVCGHLNLLPLAAPLAARHRARLVQVVYGKEAWGDPGRLRRALVRRVDSVVAVSAFTRRRMLDWSGLPAERVTVIPNPIDLAAFGPGPKRPELLRRYGLAGRTVVLTLGRMSSAERYKGHDEMLEVLPRLGARVPDLSYLVVGDGDDRPRLERKARRLGVSDRVVFTGYVPDDQKADHYRLADVFAMPGRGEGFGFVYLEALACGVPVVASLADASSEAVLGGALGELAHPDDPQGIADAVCRALRRERAVPAALERYSVGRFRPLWREQLPGADVGSANGTSPAPEAQVASTLRPGSAHA